jgi:hypothetical protein
MPGKYVEVSQLQQVDLSYDLLQNLIAYAKEANCYAIMLLTSDTDLLQIAEYDLGFVRNVYWLDKSTQIWDTVLQHMWGIKETDLRDTPYGQVASLDHVDVTRHHLVPLSCINGVNHFASMFPPSNPNLMHNYQALSQFNLFEYGYGCEQSLWDRHEQKVPAKFMDVLIKMNTTLVDDSTVRNGDQLFGFAFNEALAYLSLDCPSFLESPNLDITLSFSDRLYPSKFVQPVEVGPVTVLISTIKEHFSHLIVDTQEGALYINTDLPFTTRLVSRPPLPCIFMPVGFHSKRPITRVYIAERRSVNG